MSQIKFVAILLLLYLPGICFCQKSKTTSGDSAFYQIPFKDNQIVYEKVYYLDSVNNKEQIFNAVKSVLIRNTNYKYSKIDEDRVSGNITAQISYDVVSKPGIAKLLYACKSTISIDVKENRYRVKLFNNSSSTMVLGHLFEGTMEQQYEGELDSLKKGKWRAGRSTILDWNLMLTLILDGFSTNIKEDLRDNF